VAAAVRGHGRERLSAGWGDGHLHAGNRSTEAARDGSDEGSNVWPARLLIIAAAGGSHGDEEGGEYARTNVCRCPWSAAKKIFFHRLQSTGDDGTEANTLRSSMRTVRDVRTQWAP
jgi:hypothetical protein